MHIKFYLSASLLVFVVAGCSSGSDDDTDDSNVSTCSEYTECPSGGGLGGFLEWLSGACTTRTVCPTDPGSANLDRNPWEIGTQEEAEPNDTLQQALPVFMESFVPGEPEPPIVNVSGRVSPTDVADYIAFSTDSPQTTTIYLCETLNLCGDRTYSDDAVYLEVLDANGTVIASTAVTLGPRGHEIIMGYTPGLVYFVRIVTDNLTAGQFEYRVVLLAGIRS